MCESRQPASTEWACVRESVLALPCPFRSRFPSGIISFCLRVPLMLHVVAVCGGVTSRSLYLSQGSLFLPDTERCFLWVWKSGLGVFAFQHFMRFGPPPSPHLHCFQQELCLPFRPSLCPPPPPRWLTEKSGRDESAQYSSCFLYSVSLNILGLCIHSRFASNLGTCWQLSLQVLPL